MIIIWIVIMLFLMMTIMFYKGKGAFLIAGYNTSSPEEKAKVDEKKLCHLMGNGMLVVTLALITKVLLIDVMPVWLLVVVVFIDVIYILVYGNTRCNRDVNEPLLEINKKKQAISKKLVIGIGLLSAVVSMAFLFMGNISMECNDKALIAKATFVKTSNVIYDDVAKIEIVSDIDIGRRKNGLGNFKVDAGHFKNDVYQDYMLYSYKRCKSYIVITQKNQSIVVVNKKTIKATKQLYQTLKTSMP